MKRDSDDQTFLNLKNQTEEHLEISSTGYGLESSSHEPNNKDKRKNSTECGGL